MFTIYPEKPKNKQKRINSINLKSVYLISITIMQSNIYIERDKSLRAKLYNKRREREATQLNLGVRILFLSLSCSLTFIHREKEPKITNT